MALTQVSTQGIKDGTITGTDLATNIDLVDNQKLRLGTGNDLQIYHNGTNSFIDNSTGYFNINSNGSTLFLDGAGAGVYLRVGAAGSEENAVIATPNGAVELYHNDSKKFETTSAGVSVTGGITTSGASTFNEDVTFTGVTSGRNIVFDKSANQISVLDDAKISFGNANDLQIYHDGSNSFISDTGTGGIKILGSAVYIKNVNDHDMVEAISGGAVSLFHNNSKKFETTSDGATLTGSLTVTDDITLQDDLLMGDTDTIKLGNSVDLQIQHDGTDSHIKNLSGETRIQCANIFKVTNYQNTETYIKGSLNGSVELYHDNSKKFETHSGGVNVTGSVNPTGNVALVDNSKLKLGTGDDLQIFHDGTTNKITLGGKELRILGGGSNDKRIFVANTSNAAELYFDNVKKMETTDVGITSLDTLISQGEIRPGPDNDHSIGRSNRRYITIFAVNGSINTSDKNEKNTIIDSDLGLDFINRIKMMVKLTMD